uniref:Uncharacterized protein n=1 Tax=Euplotes crassus TaxID=5936 RepID=A0A7S3NRQ5_EUPCR|mmetsp:Transcript_1445/g.1391  ORF Transcript_1445/g.1391 Transcript_1445/m.1391 type:complete len:197 (+) Transcript_1445:849-1439(+)|eukprot:CAMPEP_0197000982 /NCGR_PEP_ID=MMETSP1380-20130617/5782_1 /TAXON_ID=5936 /ORGANISM="Euplotes crassus, Strain CT5" /LENGTH=196 /DNA_ID=CAMNT_0042418469 /DNA_START=851 /DNA_END=1441 /DNA_ORIENTATION=+
MNYEHDYYYDWIIKKNSKVSVPIPPRIKAVDEEPNKPTAITDMKPPLNTNIMNKVRGNSVDAPIIRRDTYNNLKNLNWVSNPYNQIKYGSINPINGLTYQDFNPRSSQRDPPTNMVTTTGMMSHLPPKGEKVEKFGASALNFRSDRPLRNISSNTYMGILGAPALKKSHTSDYFNQPSKAELMNKRSSQQIATGRG